MILVAKNINDLTFDDFDFIFKKAYPQIPDNVKEDRFITYESEYVLITNLGCSLVIWNDYRIEMFSDVIPKLKFNLIEITNALLEVGALVIGIKI